MRNRNVGFLIIGIAVVIGALVAVFDSAVRNSIVATCSHGPSCSMYSAVNTQTTIALIVVAVIFIIGLVLVFTKESERIVVRKQKEPVRKIDLSKLDKHEAQVVRTLMAENGAVFQASLMEKLQMGKVGMTRLLDKLEAKQIIERKRRGMNNIIVLKN